ncbi:TIGR03749 family integrating conjugative element protein [Billgrantia endophytica]|uniref:TIGR03749 family integrating conjugative element protein n=1 Tax=Billgrantia endophytica TaxID=2033802 RepID=A0A2N7U4A5_9GAMM|nr:TIGR03749 family integrating conjugative element protein [Halomonas endophytica]PMR75274.1 TIGR03749 family integrating conjugative element protein [Halomonas endophytica]
MKRLITRSAVSLVLCACLGLMLMPIGSAHAIEILRWERMPLAVPLVVGEERVVFVDRHVRVGVPASLDDRLRVQSAGGALYLRASETIEPTRLQVQDVETGELILLDIAAEPADGSEPPLEPVRIVEGEAAATRYGTSPSSPPVEPAAAEPPRRETPLPVVLTRYAAQNLYAPLRTVEPVPGITRVNLPRDLALDSLLPSVPVNATPLAAWRLDDRWVTAVRLTNTSSGWLDLDPRALQGDIMTATFQHADLGPAGRPSDTTVVYLVTRGRGLAGSLLPTISPIDASMNLPPVTPTRGGTDEE